MLDEVGLGFNFRIGLAHTVDERVDQAVHERLAESQEGVAVAHCTTQDAADDVTGLGIAGQLTVGHRESDGAHVVGHYTHGDIHVLVVTVFLAAHLSQFADKGLEDVGIIVGLLALEHHAQALEAHTGIDHLVGQRLE